jgi:hypothetical protein
LLDMVEWLVEGYQTAAQRGSEHTLELGPRALLLFQGALWDNDDELSR